MKFPLIAAFIKRSGASDLRAAKKKSVTPRQIAWKAALILPYLFSTALLQAENFPQDSNVINVKTAFGAVGDGVADDTVAIRNAINAHVGTGLTLYFPNGTYLISKTLDWKKNHIKSRVKIPTGMTHALAGGLTANAIHSVYSSLPGGMMNYAAVKADTPNNPAVNAIKVASAEGSGESFFQEWAIFAFETGVIMNDQLAAPARRVGFFVGSDNTPALTTAGWQLFDAAVNWARNNGPASALMVVGDPANLQVTDVAIRDRMAGMGITVTVVDDQSSQSGDAAGKGVVYLSGSVERLAVTTKFRTVTVPVICSKAELYAAMSMATGDCRTWMNRLIFMGESKTGTIIKLKDNCPGFMDANASMAMISTGSTMSSGAPSPYAGGGGDAAYHNHIYDLTVDCGIGNGGAVGIDYMANNCGAMRNVLVKSSDPAKIGKAGVNVTRAWVGPCLLQDITVDGFSYGIKGGDNQYGVTLDKINLSNQKTYGIETGAQVFHISDLTSTNTVPVIHLSSATAQLTLVNGTFNGGISGNSAIKVKDNTCKAYVRNVTSSGYDSCVKVGTSVIAGSHHDQYVVSSLGILSLFDSPQMSLELPIQSAPAVYYSSDFANQWISVATYGADPYDTLDDTDAIRTAMALGRPIVYFPKGNSSASKYLISGTIDVPAHVKRIIGVGTDLKGTFVLSGPAFRFTGGSASDVTTMERFWAQVDTKGGPYIQNDTTRTLYFRDITFGARSPGYRNSLGAGKCFFENVLFTGSVMFEYPQDVWARQLNVELAPGLGVTGVTNDGGNLWILGLKTEQDFVALKTTGGGNTELLGGFLMPGVGTGTEHPLSIGFINEDSSHSLIYTTHTGNTDDDFPIHVRETRAGVTSDLLHSAVIYTGGASSRAWMPLYVGYKENTTLYFTDFLGGASGEPAGWTEASSNIMGLDVVDGDYRCTSTSLWGMSYSTDAAGAASGDVVSADFVVAQSGKMGGPLIGDMVAKRYFWARYSTSANKLQICFLNDVTSSFSVIAEVVASQPFNTSSTWAIDFGYSGNIAAGSTADTALTASLYKDGQLTATVTTPATTINVAATSVGIKTNNLVLFKNFSVILP